MGIYVQATATIPIKLTGQNIAERLLSSAEQWATARGLRALFFATKPDLSGVSISFYPPAGLIQFSVSKGHVFSKGRVSFGVKTSGNGPGYHRALIDLCDWLQAELGLNWDWCGGGDQTNYALQRNVLALEQSYLDQFVGLCEFMRENAHLGNIKINLPIDLAAEGFSGVATPVGLIPSSFFEQALEPGLEKIRFAEQLMPWWRETLDSKFWAGTLREILWSEVEWRAAESPWESHTLAAAFMCYERLGEDEQNEFKSAIVELAAISDAPPGTSRPFVEGIGWKRRARWFSFPGPWRVKLPGYYCSNDENNGETTCLWFGTEEIRGTSLIVKLSKGANIPWSEKYSESVERQLPSNPSVCYRISNAIQPSQNADGFFLAWSEFHAVRNAEERDVLMVSIFDAHDKLTARLESVAKDIWFDPPLIAEAVPHLS